MQTQQSATGARGHAKRRSPLVRVLIGVLIGLGGLLLAAVVLLAATLVPLLRGPGPADVTSPGHPFRSEKARARYLAFEEGMEKGWPVVSEMRTVRTSWGTTFMRISGPDSAAPLVLLPGGGSCGLIWQPTIKAMSEVYQTYALDNIYDYGRSVYSREIKSGADFAAWLDELFDSLRLGNDIRLMGYSYGGWVASQYALSHPDRLSRLVLIAPAGTVLPISDEFLLRMLLTLLPSKYFLRKDLYWVWDDLVRSGPEGKAITDERVDYVSLAYRTGKFKAGVNPAVLTDAELNRITAPALFLVGEHEKAYDPVAAVERLHRVAPGIRTAMVEGTGHDLMFTHAETVNRRILEFLGDSGVVR